MSRENRDFFLRDDANFYGLSDTLRHCPWIDPSINIRAQLQAVFRNNLETTFSRARYGELFREDIIAFCDDEARELPRYAPINDFVRNVISKIFPECEHDDMISRGLDHLMNHFVQRTPWSTLNRPLRWSNGAPADNSSTSTTFTISTVTASNSTNDTGEDVPF